MKTLLDLFCGAGGCSDGYNRAGFKVVGIDINAQPNYPFKFIQMDALEADLLEFDVVHASPPCQAYSLAATRARGEYNYKYPDLIEPIRKKLIKSHKPYIIENVIGAPLISPIRLCGEMFGLKTFRHRIFEANIILNQPYHIKHKGKVGDGKYFRILGSGGKNSGWLNKTDKPGTFEDWKKAMGINWMTRKELIQAIPPAYTEYIGKQVMKFLNLNEKIQYQMRF